MVTIFNRKKVATVMSANTQRQMRSALKAAGIDFSVKVKASANAGQQEAGHDHSSVYNFYVRKEDAEKAKKVLEIDD